MLKEMKHDKVQVKEGSWQYRVDTESVTFVVTALLVNDWAPKVSPLL